MRVSVFAMALAIAVAVAAILVLIALPGPGVDRGAVDRRTGVVLSADPQVVARALATGDVTAAFHLLMNGGELAVPTPWQQALALMLRDELMAAESLPTLAAEPTDVERAFAADEAAPPTGTEPGIDRRAALLAARLAGPPAQRPSAADSLAMALAFADVGRARARDRWFLRAMAADPHDVAVRLDAARAWIAEQRLPEAAALLADVAPPQALALPFWQLRNDLARWLGDLAVEQQALEHICPLIDDPRPCGRLVEVATARGDMLGAARASTWLAARTGLPEHRRQAVLMLFAAGLRSEGYAVLQRCIDTDDDPQEARRQLAALLLEDLRLDEAQRVLEDVLQHGDDARDVDALETVYRRRDQRAPLLQLLRQHLMRDMETPFEVVNLLAAEDRSDEAQQVLEQLFAEITDPVQFFRLLPWFHDRGLPDVPTVTAAMAERIEPEQLQFALDSMAIASFDRSPALTVLARRFPNDAAVRESRLAVVWTLAESDPVAALARARSLAAEHPRDAEIQNAWVVLAERRGDPEEQADARRQLAITAPGDCKNRRLLAGLLTQLHRDRAAIAELEQLYADGDRSARGPLLHALAAAGRDDLAAPLIDALAEDGVEPLLEAADVLFGDDRHATALRLYQRALQLAPDDRHATERVGLLLGWTNQPNEALPLLRRAFDDPDADHFKVAFTLAEVEWALSLQEAARSHYAAALASADARADSTGTGRMIARCLHRTGRLREALAVYLGLRAGEQQNNETLLDIAELYVDLDDDDALLATLAEVERRDPDDRRLLRLRAQRLLRRGDPDGARALLLRIGERHEHDAGELADLGGIDEWAGEFGSALATYRRWAALQDARDARAAEQRLADRLSPHIGLQAAWRTVGDDSVLESAVHAAATIDERTRLQARAGYGDYRGRSQVIGGGATDVTASTPLLDLGVAWRYGAQQDQLGAGIRLHPDAPGDRKVGAWIEQHWISDLPSWAVSLRLYGDELWTDPAAAVGFEGRASGAQLSGYEALGDASWCNGEVAWRRIDARAPGQTRLRDGELVVNAQLGHRWTDGDIAVADPFTAHRAPAGPECPWLGHGPREIDDLHLSTWLGVTADRVLDNAALTAILPLSERVTFLYAAARADRRLVAGVGASLEGMLGTDVEHGRPAWEASAALTWRPDFAVQLDGRFGVGDAFGRQDFNGNTMFAQLEAVLRW